MLEYHLSHDSYSLSAAEVGFVPTEDSVYTYEILVFDSSGFLVVCYANLDSDARNIARQRPVENFLGDHLRVWHDQLGAVPSLDHGGTHADPVYRPPLPVDDDRIADLDGSLEQQDQAADEVVNDILQAETNADTEGTGEDGEVLQFDAGHGHRHQETDQHEAVMAQLLEGVADATVYFLAEKDPEQCSAGISAESGEGLIRPSIRTNPGRTGENHANQLRLPVGFRLGEELFQVTADGVDGDPERLGDLGEIHSRGKA